MNWLTKFIGKAKAVDQPSLETIVNEYGKVRGVGQLVERDVRELPFSKEVIKKGLWEAIQITNAPNMRETLKTGYVSIADFQDIGSLKGQDANIPQIIADEMAAWRQELKDHGI